jgi:hypothetical protein
MTGTDLCVIKFNQSRSYLNHLVHLNNKGIVRKEAHNNRKVTGMLFSMRSMPKLHKEIRAADFD